MQSSLTEALERRERKDDDEEELAQRPVDFNAPIRARGRKPGKRVKVYNRCCAAIQMTDCILGPEEEGEILVTDANDPRISHHLLKLA
jgi:hypothetical protein